MDSKTRFLVTDRFYVDRRSEALVVDGRPVSVNQRTYQVMLLLMSRPGELVTKRELFEQIWETLEVSDAVLTTAIKELRQALGDDARAPWAIATVHARGYRFLPDVQKRETLEDPAANKAPELKQPRFPKIGLFAIFSVLAIVLAYTLLSGPETVDGPATEAVPNSIAVLPFDDLSEAGDQKWFADGLAEEILNSLAQSRDLLVAARNSSFRYGGGDAVDIREVAQALNVTHIMEGSVRRETDQLRVTAQLIRADDGFHVWSKTYDFPIATGNALSLQRNIAEDVLVTLEADGMQADIENEPAPIPLDIFEQYLRGRQLVMSRRPDAVLEGLDTLNSLVQIAPEFAPGHAWLAYAYMFSTAFSGRPILQSSISAEQHVRRAMELDPDGADPLTSAALLELMRSDVNAALEFANRAVAANPNHVPALRRRGVILLNLNRLEEAHRDLLAALARDPLSAISLAHVASTYSALNNRQQALQAVKEGVRWNPDDAIANASMSRVLANVGEYVEAIRYAERSVEINPNAALATLALAALYWQVGLDDRVEFADPSMVWNGLAAASLSAGNQESAMELVETYGSVKTGSVAGIHIYHWIHDMNAAYSPAMRTADQDDLAGIGLDYSYRRGAIPAMLALEANGDPQAVIIRENLANLFQDKKPGDYAFRRDIYGAASWHMVSGTHQEAMAWLQDALDKGFIFRELHLDPIWDPIRESPEFQAILDTSDKLAESVRSELALSR